MSDKRIIRYDFGTVRRLYESYMPFVVGGGLFIPSHDNFRIGEEIQLDIKLLHEVDRLVLDAKVVWFTPLGALGGKTAGVGVQFLHQDSTEIITRIETYLAGMLTSDVITKTM